MKKFSQILLAAGLAMSMTASPIMSSVTTMPVLATDPNPDAEPGPDTEEDSGYTLTIDNTIVGNKYNLYMIFSGTLGTPVTAEDQEADKALGVTGWGDGLTDTGKKALITQINTVLNLEDDALTNTDTAIATASEVAAKLNGMSEANVRTIVDNVVKTEGALNESPTESATATGTSTAITGLDVGYYIVTEELKESDDPLTDTVSLALLKVVGTRTISLKKDQPTIEKKVNEDNTYDGNWSILRDENGDPLKNGEGQVIAVPDTNAAKDDHYNDVADYSFGQTFEYELIASLPSDFSTYDKYYLTFKDSLSKGLIPDEDSVEVFVIKTDGSSAKVDLTKSVSKDAEGKDEISDVDDPDNISFETITTTGKFNEGKLLTVTLDDVKSLVTTNDGSSTRIAVDSTSKIVVRYTAELDPDNADMGETGNPNEVYLIFSNNPYQQGDEDTGKTEPDYAVVFTFELDATKIKKDTPDTKLSGAEFVFYYVDDNNTPNNNTDDVKYYYKKVVDSTSNKTTVSWVTDKAQATPLTSDDNGKFGVKGLGSGTYYLEETKAPTGYNLPTAPFEVVISAEGTDGASINTQEWDGTTKLISKLTLQLDGTTSDLTTDAQIEAGKLSGSIANGQGSTLPETGGMGTTMLYVAGGALVLGSVVFFMTNRKMKKD